MRVCAASMKRQRYARVSRGSMMSSTANASAQYVGRHGARPATKPMCPPSFVTRNRTLGDAAARARAVDSIKPLLAGYPTGGTPTSNPDLDLVSRRAANTIDEYFGSARIDYNINDKTMLYVRYNRDQGYLQSPLDVSGSYMGVTAVPQNAVINLQRAITPTMRPPMIGTTTTSGPSWCCQGETGSNDQCP